MFYIVMIVKCTIAWGGRNIKLYTRKGYIVIIPIIEDT